MSAAASAPKPESIGFPGSVPMKPTLPVSSWRSRATPWPNSPAPLADACETLVSNAAASRVMTAPAAARSR